MYPPLVDFTVLRHPAKSAPTVAVSWLGGAWYLKPNSILGRGRRYLAICFSSFQSSRYGDDIFLQISLRPCWMSIRSVARKLHLAAIDLNCFPS